jgi:hypothetical protein
LEKLNEMEKAIMAIALTEKDEDNMAVIDTVAEETVFPNYSNIMEVYERYDDEHPSPSTLISCAGEAMNVVACGKINDILDHVFVVDGLEKTLLSGVKLQAKGLWLLFPPKNMSPYIGVIVADEDGRVRMLGDWSMNTNIALMDSYDYHIELPRMRDML